MQPEAEFFIEIQTKVLRVFLPAFHIVLCSFAFRLLILQTHATSYSFYSQLLYTVKEKEGKLDRKPYFLPYGLRNPYKNLTSENFKIVPMETSTKLYVHEFGFMLESRTKHKSLPEGKGKVWTVKDFGNQKRQTEKKENK